MKLIDSAVGVDQKYIYFVLRALEDAYLYLLEPWSVDTCYNTLLLVAGINIYRSLTFVYSSAL